MKNLTIRKLALSALLFTLATPKLWAATATESDTFLADLKSAVEESKKSTDLIGDSRVLATIPKMTSDGEKFINAEEAVRALKILSDYPFVTPGSQKVEQILTTHSPKSLDKKSFYKTYIQTVWPNISTYVSRMGGLLNSTDLLNSDQKKDLGQMILKKADEASDPATGRIDLLVSILHIQTLAEKKLLKISGEEKRNLADIRTALKDIGLGESKNWPSAFNLTADEQKNIKMIDSLKEKDLNKAFSLQGEVAQKTEVQRKKFRTILADLKKENK